MFLFMRYGFFILVMLGLCSCNLSKPETPSIVVVAVDSLGVGDINCATHNEGVSAFEILCAESVRFTHAFTPSTMSVPTLASLLTAQYPITHGLRHNGQGLSANLNTLAEEAIQKNYRTAFFSGGAPVIRKTGLNQGFEIFDDSFVPTLRQIYRPVDKDVESMTHWLKTEVKSSSFLAFIYLPDLGFPLTETTNDLGETRNLSLESQVEEIDESLFHLIDTLKKQKRWDSTVFVLVGLSGRPSDQRNNELTGFNLYSENAQVTLFIKPPSKIRDAGINWKVDRNISLVDVGATLFDYLGLAPAPIDNPLHVSSLRSELTNQESNQSDPKLILSESAWPLWRGFSGSNDGGIRYSLRRDQYLYIHDQKPKMYNSLSDRLEQSPMSQSEMENSDFYKQAKDYFAHKNISPWQNLPANVIDKFYLAGFLESGESSRPNLISDLKILAKKQGEDLQIKKWMADLALKSQSWKELEKLGQDAHEQTWLFIAQKNLKEKTNFPQNPCLSLLKQSMYSVEDLKRCNDKMFVELVDWIRPQIVAQQRDQAQEKFLRSYINYKIDEKIALANYSSGMVWDVVPEKTDGPCLSDLILSLPEYGRFNAIAKRRMSSSVSN